MPDEPPTSPARSVADLKAQLTQLGDGTTWKVTIPLGTDSLDVEFLEQAGGVADALLDLALQVLPQVDDFITRGQIYLESIARWFPFDRPGGWEIDWVQFGFYNEAIPQSFDLMYTHEGDYYGCWGVRFVSGPSGFYANDFRRNHW